MQAVAQLPVGLQISILAALNKRLPEQLAMLPPGLHLLALQAANPSINSDAALKMSSTEVPQYGHIIWPLLQ